MCVCVGGGGGGGGGSFPRSYQLLPLPPPRNKKKKKMAKNYDICTVSCPSNAVILCGPSILGLVTLSVMFWH